LEDKQVYSHHTILRLTYSVNDLTYFSVSELAD